MRPVNIDPNLSEAERLQHFNEKKCKICGDYVSWGPQGTYITGVYVPVDLDHRSAWYHFKCAGGKYDWYASQYGRRY